MKITLTDWIKFKNTLSAISTKASDELVEWLQERGGYTNVDRDELTSYAYALATKYGEASASLTAEMYDEVAELSGIRVPSAEVAETVSYGEIAKAINGITKIFTTDSNVASVVGRYVKRTAEDTTLNNAERDGAQFAWVPSGDTCAFCITLASRGWQYMSKQARKNGHASHIHANCDCTYAIRFDNKTEVEGYDPQVYKDMYYGAEGNTPQERINSMRRELYQQNKDKINEQKRINYAEKKANYMKKNSETVWSSKSKLITEEQYNELSEFASSKGIVLDQSFKSFDGDVSLVQDFVTTMETNLSDKTYMRNKDIKLSVSYTMNDEDYAKTEGSNVIINGFAYRDRSLLKTDYQNKVETKWFTQNSTYLDIATHESGHVIVYMNQLKYSGVYESVFGLNKVATTETVISHISEYAMETEKELISESYVCYKNGSTDEYVLKVLQYCGIVK